MLPVLRDVLTVRVVCLTRNLLQSLSVRKWWLGRAEVGFWAFRRIVACRGGHLSRYFDGLVVREQQELMV